jgi:hypothetical protein
MKWLNTTMLVIRILAFLLVVGLILDYVQGWGLISRPEYFIIIVIFAVIYLFGTITQVMLRVRSQQQQ